MLSSGVPQHQNTDLIYKQTDRTFRVGGDEGTDSGGSGQVREEAGNTGVFPACGYDAGRIHERVPQKHRVVMNR